MKSKTVLSLSATLLALFLIAGYQNVEAAEVSYTPPTDGSHEYIHHSYHTSDPVFSTWYPSEAQSFAYPGGRPTQAGRSGSNFVYTSPTNVFDTWAGNGRSANTKGDAGGYSSGSGNGRGPGGK